MITYNEVINLLRYEPDTGNLYWLKRTNPKQRADLLAGCTRERDGYTQIGINGRVYPAHRLAMLISFGFYGESYEVDHINHIRHDNRLCNLRFVSVVDNRRNQSISSKSTTGVTGVYYNKRMKRYAAQIKVDKQVHYLGLFDTLEQAAEARKEADKYFKFNANHGTNKAQYVRKKANA